MNPILKHMDVNELSVTQETNTKLKTLLVPFYPMVKV